MSSAKFQERDALLDNTTDDDTTLVDIQSSQCDQKPVYSSRVLRRSKNLKSNGVTILDLYQNVEEDEEDEEDEDYVPSGSESDFDEYFEDEEVEQIKTQLNLIPNLTTIEKLVIVITFLGVSFAIILGHLMTSKNTKEISI